MWHTNLFYSTDPQQTTAEMSSSSPVPAGITSLSPPPMCLLHLCSPPFSRLHHPSLSLPIINKKTSSSKAPSINSPLGGMDGVGTLEQDCCSIPRGIWPLRHTHKSPCSWLQPPTSIVDAGARSLHSTAPQGCPMCYFLPEVNCFGKCFAKHIPEGLLSILGCFDQSCLRSSFQGPG